MSKQGYNGNYRERYKTEVEASIKKDQTIKMQKEAIQEQAELINELSGRCLNWLHWTTEASIKKDQTIKMQKEAIQEQAELINELSGRCLNLSYDLRDIKAQVRREGSYKAVAVFGWIVVSLLICKEIIG